MRSRRFMLYPLVCLFLLFCSTACERGTQGSTSDSQTSSHAELDEVRNAATLDHRPVHRPTRGLVTGNPPTLTPFKPDDTLSFMEPELEEAATRFSQSKIKGGKPAAKGDYPWATLLTFNYDPYFIPFCSGALIDDRWVLTAAHCAQMLWQSDVAWIGGTDLAADPGESRFIDRWLCHPDYDRDAKVADLALVRLEEPSNSPTHLPLANANSKNGFPEQAVTIVGYGETNDITGPLTAVLHVLDTSVVSAPVCQTFYPDVTDPTISNKHICAGDTAATTCSRDSGGPLFVTQQGSEEPNKEIEGIGAASFVGACTVPGGFTRISMYQSWIDDVVSNGSTASSCP